MHEKCSAIHKVFPALFGASAGKSARPRIRRNLFIAYWNPPILLNGKEWLL
jgi:hypothetical protein